MEKVEKKNLVQPGGQFVYSQCRICHKSIIAPKDSDPLTHTCSRECTERYDELICEKHWN